jgi:hypothetical protein
VRIFTPYSSKIFVHRKNVNRFSGERNNRRSQFPAIAISGEGAAENRATATVRSDATAIIRAPVIGLYRQHKVVHRVAEGKLRDFKHVSYICT